MLLLHASTEAFSRADDVEGIAAELTRAVQQVVWSHTGAQVRADVFLDDGTGLRQLGRPAPFDQDLPPFRPLLASLVRSGTVQPREVARGTWALFGSPQPGTVLAVEVRGVSPARRSVTTGWISVVENVIGAAALALARAEGVAGRREAEEYHRGVLAAITDAFISVDPAGRILGWNEGSMRLTGWEEERIVGRDIIETLVPSRHQDAARAMLEGLLVAGRGDAPIEPFEALVLHADGSRIPIEARVWKVVSGPDTHVCLLARDISKRKMEEAALTRRATHDPLTDLPNRALITDLLTQSLAGSKRVHGPVGTIFVDLDGFKQVNDRLGHAAGDRLLVAAAMRLLRAVASTDVVGRLSGDEFLVVCRGLERQGDLDRVAERIRDAMAEPFSVTDAGLVTVRPSLGLALGVPGTVSARELVAEADRAMYADKDRNRADDRADARADDRADARAGERAGSDRGWADPARPSSGTPQPDWQGEARIA
ncbi:MAG TPA: sensor domain-containing diguanylate cyclase [Acidimicrobiales bacterium]|nr:sensor domain-containing diguanylate cyclase [Acidimicrobiales bacterium]